jgi:hypothetical protein
MKESYPMNTSPFTTAELIRLPRNAYAYRNRFGVWGIRQDAVSVETVVETGNNQPLRPSDYYLAPVDSVVIASRQARATQVERSLESANYWN